ncbi:ABC transporter ATP-binding protein [Vagococcus acidifermentans]|uniref:Multidrug ABC transporter ATP-binding protein n=1 Tax=Vagococcus acidifermentans TaxID=564710 RepID=A0A430B0V4_9ENTE|nr:ABC transporter ATP-binding protein [Vagococcus acidifermentans]RSU13881.1 multidrug ABC transporter ATP-binding protein [Vagococcus acidifermentans]
MAKNTFSQDETLQEEFNWFHYKRLFQYIVPYKKPFMLILLTIILANIAAMAGPYFTKLAIDEIIPQKNITMLITISVIFFVSLLFISWCLKYRIWHITKLGQQILLDIRYDIFTHLQKLPFSYFDARPHGKILIRVVNYINTLSDLLSNGLINLISDLFNVAITLIVMFLIDVKLTLYSLALLPVLFLITMIIKNRQRKAYQHLSNKQSNLNAYIHESISGVRITQSFTREERNERIFDELSNDYRTAWMKAIKIMRLLWPSVENISILTTCLIYFIGIRQIGVEVSTGTLIAFMGYINNFWNPVINIGNFYNSLITATAYLERIFETLDEQPEIQDKEDAQVLDTVQGNVSFEHVSFRYETKGRKILDDVTFSVAPGQSIALVGPTGAGKTTVINLISRFYDVDEGSVKVDGKDVRDVTLQSLRSQMGVMLQDTFIFSGTILENIRYGKLDATEEEIIRASKAVRAHEFIKELKDGYQTVVEERGSTLSAGQRQLISFARALLADPRILILDEATSSIDTHTEELLQKGLNELLKNRTSFIIAHRLSTIKNSSEIFFIDQGRIIERGTHDELMAKKGRYYFLYQSQYDLLKAE